MMTARDFTGTEVSVLSTLGTYGEWAVTRTLDPEPGRFAVRHWPTGLRAETKDDIQFARILAQRLDRSVPRAPMYSTQDAQDWTDWIQTTIYSWVVLHVKPVVEEGPC